MGKAENFIRIEKAGLLEELRDLGFEERRLRDKLKPIRKRIREINKIGEEK